MVEKHFKNQTYLKKYFGKMTQLSTYYFDIKLKTEHICL